MRGALGGLILVCCVGPSDPTLCDTVRASAWEVPPALEPVLQVESEACMRLVGGELYAFEATGWAYDPVPATCSGGTVTVEGHGRFILQEEPEGLEAHSAKYLVSLELEPCPY